MKFIIPILLLFIGIIIVENKEYCDFVFNLKDGTITLSYFSSTIPQNNDDQCITPSTTITENVNYGRVFKLLATNVRNEVPILHRATVANFSHLVELDFRQIGIKTIKTAAFINLSELRSVNLENNKIEEIQLGAFQRTPDIKFINLRGNRLKQLNSNWLQDLPNLQNLNVSYNTITNMEGAFDNVIDIEILDISHNSLISISTKNFNSLRSLRILNLSYNLIHKIENGAFMTVKKLRLLNLYNNNITYFTSETLNNWLPLHDLIILYNPISCVCLQDTTKWLARNGINLNKHISCEASIGNIPICVETNEKVCSHSDDPSLYTNLHSGNQDHNCYLPLNYV